MQSFQLEEEHHTDESDDEEGKSEQIDDVESTDGGLPKDDERTEYGEYAESHIPTPLWGSVTFQVYGIACGGETAKHHPECDDERNHFHTEQGIGYQVETQDEINGATGNVPSPRGEALAIAQSKGDFDDATCQHGDAEYDA